jgi:glycerol-3-phosphate responsive antiterminator
MSLRRSDDSMLEFLYSGEFSVLIPDDLLRLNNKNMKRKKKKKQCYVAFCLLSAPDEEQDIVVEFSNKEYHLHRMILAKKSTYFRAMFTGEWKESKGARVR